MPLSERNCLTGRLLRHWCVRSQRIISYRIIPFLRLILYAEEHGYISGEHFTCPKCGKKAEVYSRITGYYRPVQNWNDGKAQEYKNRTLYDVMHSDVKKASTVHMENPAAVQMEKTAEKNTENNTENSTKEFQPVHTTMVTMTSDDVKIEPVASHKYLFTTSTCPNCRMAKKMLEGEELEIIDAEKNPEIAKQFGIMQAPTLVITDGEHMTKYVNASNIQRVCGRRIIMKIAEAGD